jgi:aromatic-amino-acid transaminase
MLSHTDAKARGLADLPPVNSDSLLALIALCDADPRPEKIDVGVGVFRDAACNTPILKVMKEAEQRLVDRQVKAYWKRGRQAFRRATSANLLGHHASDERIAGLQTPGGCGAPGWASS